MDRANVASIEAIRDFRAHLLNFVAEARESLENEALELRRGLDWVLDEQPEYWREQIKRSQDEILEAKLALSRCRAIPLPDGRPPSCYEEKELLDQARRRLDRAEEKAGLTRRWGHTLEHESNEYLSRAGQFEETLTTLLPRAVGTLDRVLTILESYASGGLAPPAGESVAQQVETETDKAKPAPPAKEPLAPPQEPSS